MEFSSRKDANRLMLAITTLFKYVFEIFFNITSYTVLFVALKFFMVKILTPFIHACVNFSLISISFLVYA